MTQKDTDVDAMVHLIQELTRNLWELEAQAEKAKLMAREKFQTDLEKLRLGFKNDAPSRDGRLALEAAAATRAHCPNWPEPGPMN